MAARSRFASLWGFYCFFISLLLATPLHSNSLPTSGESLPNCYSELTHFPALFPLYPHVRLQCGVENRFLVPELSTQRLLFHLPVSKNHFIFQLEHFGYSHFGSIESSLGYARQFGRSFSTSMQFHHLYYYVSGYENKQGVTFSLSFWLKLNSKMGMGVALYNPPRIPFLDLQREPMPVSFQWMMTYQVAQRVLLSAKVLKKIPGEIDFQLSGWVTAKQFHFMQQISFQQLTLGFGLEYRRFLFLFNFQYHYRLGLSPSSLITYSTL